MANWFGSIKESILNTLTYYMLFHFLQENSEKNSTEIINNNQHETISSQQTIEEISDEEYILDEYLDDFDDEDYLDEDDL